MAGAPGESKTWEEQEAGERDGLNELNELNVQASWLRGGDCEMKVWGIGCKVDKLERYCMLRYQCLALG